MSEPGKFGPKPGPRQSAFIALPREWMTQAACHGAPMADFFPHHSSHARAAKRVCRRCPVIDKCLHHAIAADIAYGVWGGKSEAERRRLRYAVLRGWLSFPDPDDGLDWEGVA